MYFIFILFAFLICCICIDANNQDTFTIIEENDEMQSNIRNNDQQCHLDGNCMNSTESNDIVMTTFAFTDLDKFVFFRFFHGIESQLLGYLNFNPHILSHSIIVPSVDAKDREDMLTRFYQIWENVDNHPLRWYEMDREKRTIYIQFIKDFQEFLIKYPLDTTFRYLLGMLYYRLGYFDESKQQMQILLVIFDRNSMKKCKYPNNEVSEDGTVTSFRNYECIGYTEFRRAFAAYFKNMQYMVYQDDTFTFQEKLEKLNEIFSIAHEDVIQNGIRSDDFINYKPAYHARGCCILPVVSRGLLRHTFQQFEHICEILGGKDTCVLEVNVTYPFQLSDYDKSLLKYDEEYHSRNKPKEPITINFYEASQSIREALVALELTNERFIEDGIEGYSDQIDAQAMTLGMRLGNTSVSRSVNDILYSLTNITNIYGKYLFREYYISNYSQMLPYSKENELVVINETALELVKAKDFVLSEESPILILDDIFTTQALEALRHVTLDNTIYHSPNEAGYICSYLESGFSLPIIAQTIVEMQQALPNLFCNYLIELGWAYKYDDGSELTSHSVDGIRVHGDLTAVNVNCWIVDEEEIEDSSGTSGGMTIWTSKTHSYFDEDSLNSYYIYAQREYNETSKKFSVSAIESKDGSKDAHLKMLEWLNKTEVDTTKVEIPYRSNRCVIFDSSLLHKTNPINFGLGYQRRRINLTFLFGAFRETCADAKKNTDDLKDIKSKVESFRIFEGLY